MAVKAEMNPRAGGNGRARITSVPKIVRQNIGQVAHDLVELGELQWELFQADMRMSTHRVVMALTLLAVGGAVIIGAVPIALMSVAYGLALWLEISLAWSLALAALGGLVIAAAVAWFGWAQMRSSLSAFDRSRREWNQNIQWFKETMRRQSDHRPDDQN